MSGQDQQKISGNSSQELSCGGQDPSSCEVELKRAEEDCRGNGKTLKRNRSVLAGLGTDFRAFVYENPDEVFRPDELYNHFLKVLSCKKDPEDDESWRIQTFCSGIWELFGIVFSTYKTLLWFFIVWFIWMFQSKISTYMEESRQEAIEGWSGRWPYLLIAISVFFIKAMNGPVLSKSLVTFSVTVLFYACFHEPDETTTRAVVFIFVWILDIFISLNQVHFAAPKMSGTLFFILTIFVFVISWTHWNLCTLLGLYQILGKVTHPIFLLCVLYIIIHFFYKLTCKLTTFGETNLIPSDAWAKENPKKYFVFNYILIVPNEINDNILDTIKKWRECFYIYHDNHYTVLHAVNKLMFDWKGEKHVGKVWEERGHAVWVAFPLAFLWAWTAELVTVLDAVFLVVYRWDRYFGIFLIAAVTFVDIDRMLFITNTYAWLDTGIQFENALGNVVWWIVLKNAIAFLLGWIHVLFIHYKGEVIGGPPKYLKEHEQERKAAEQINGAEDEKADEKPDSPIGILGSPSASPPRSQAPVSLADRDYNKSNSYTDMHQIDQSQAVQL